MLTKRSIAENLAIAISQSCWSTAEIAEAGQSIFKKPQAWINELAGKLRKQFEHPPKLAQLQDAIETAPIFRQATALVKTNKAHIPTAFFYYTNTKWIDWQLPTIQDCQQLASHLGIAGRTLHWLTSMHLAPDDRPHHYVCKWIKKRTGAYRLIESPKQQLKTVQRIILQDFLNRIPLHNAAHGFCRKRNPVTFTAGHVGQACCLRMDLKDFFPSISGGRVRGMFGAFGMPPEVARCLAALTTTQTHLNIIEPRQPAGNRGQFSASRLYLPAHLPQGAPTSPAIANIMAYRLDARLSGLAAAANVHYTRYADDLLFSGDRLFGRQAKTFATTVGAIVLEQGFQINHHKTKIQFASQRQTATGIVLNQHPNINRRDYDRLKAILFNCVKHGPSSQNHDGLANFKQHLSGRINWVAQVNPVRAKKLKTLLEQIDWNENPQC